MWVAGYGPKALAVAGRVSDGVIIQLADPVIIQWIMDTAREARPRPVVTSNRNASCARPTTSRTTSPTREQVRWFPAMVSNHVMDLIERYGYDSEIPHELTEYVQVRILRLRRALARRREARQFVTDEICDRFCVLGNAEQAGREAEGSSRRSASISSTSTS